MFNASFSTPKQTPSALTRYLYGEGNGSWARLYNREHFIFLMVSLVLMSGKKSCCVDYSLMIVLWMVVSAAKKRHLQLIFGIGVSTKGLSEKNGSSTPSHELDSVMEIT